MYQQLDRDNCLKAARPENDYYQRMLLSRDASPEQIENRYAELGRILHPDLDRERAHLIEDAWKLVREAYQTLSVPESKASYDSEPHRPTPECEEFGSVLEMAEELEELDDALVYASFSSTQLVQSKEEVLAEAQTTFNHDLLDVALENFSEIVTDSLGANILSFDDFIHDRDLQSAIAKTVASVWKDFSWKVATEKYRSSIEVLDATGAVDMEFVHNRSLEYALDTARRIWDEFHWEAASEYYATFTKRVTDSGLITMTQLHADEAIQQSVARQAKMIFEMNPGQMALEIYERYLEACAQSGVANNESLNMVVAPLARDHALNIFDLTPWQSAPQEYGRFIERCERTGLLSRGEMAHDEGLKRRVSDMRRQIAALYSGDLAEESLASFDDACFAAGIVTS